jgi:hypothetical protein
MEATPIHVPDAVLDDLKARLRLLTTHPDGGHFIPWELPDGWVADLRRTFRGRRRAQGLSGGRNTGRQPAG